VFNFLFKSTVYLKIYLFLRKIRPQLIGLAILLSIIFIITYSHSEYISWVEISGRKIFLGYSYLLKNVLIAFSILVYFLFIRRQKKKTIQFNKPINKTDNLQQKETFETLKEKGKLKTEYERILEGTDEKDK
tara:strand:+ start:142 stop:537 length:396 start_codon:yes stop_codon:yes gene_type:complete